MRNKIGEISFRVTFLLRSTCVPCIIRDIWPDYASVDLDPDFHELNLTWNNESNGHQAHSNQKAVKE